MAAEWAAARGCSRSIVRRNMCFRSFAIERRNKLSWKRLSSPDRMLFFSAPRAAARFILCGPVASRENLLERQLDKLSNHLYPLKVRRCSFCDELVLQTSHQSNYN